MTNLNDSGPGSLRQAIFDANASPVHDVIVFNIGGEGPQVIQPTSALPAISDSLTIDGSSQPGYVGIPIIHLDGALGGGGFAGLRVLAGSSTIRGLSITGFGDGIRLETNGGNVVEGNYVGVSPFGTAMGNYGQGIHITHQSHGNWIGTNGDGVGDAFEGNVISDNHGNGILIVQGSSGTVVAGNYIGTDPTGNIAYPNRATAGIFIFEGAHSNRIGTNGDGISDEAERNVISGNSGIGIQIAGVGFDVVAGNYIGTNADGTAPLGNSIGVKVTHGISAPVGISGVRIGTNGDGHGDLAERNVISGNRGDGVVIADDFPGGVLVQDNVVAGNYIGTDATGSTALGNSGSGIRISASANNTVGGATAEAGNVVSANSQGIVLTGPATSGNLVLGNVIGTDRTGSAHLGQTFQGIYLRVGASNNTIGGLSPGEGNLVAFSGANGVAIREASSNNAVLGNVIVENNGTGVLMIEGSSGNRIQGNSIGTDPSGTQRRGNGTTGVRIIGAHQNTVGGLSPGAGNLIADNGFNLPDNLGSGVFIDGTSNLVQGNRIGTNAEGSAAMGNATHGVAIRGGSGNSVGGSEAGAGNLLSGNGADGVLLYGGTIGNLVAGNRIGTDASGTSAVPNARHGIHLTNASQTLIGGSAPSARNLISANLVEGVLIQGGSTVDNVVAGNRIGTNADGTLPLGNTNRGIWVRNGAQRTRIGTNAVSIDEAEGNLISANGQQAILLTNGASHVTIAGNRIGTDVTGSLNFGNGNNGIGIQDATDIRVGGSSAVQGNLISGSRFSGVAIIGGGSVRIAIQGNRIGTNADGSSAIPNGNGISILNQPPFAFGSPSSIVIGTDGDGPGDATEGNLISGNNSHGVRMYGVDIRDVVVAGNRIGTNLAGTASVPNGGHGVYVDQGVRDLRIGTNADGDSDELEANLISGNAGFGVAFFNRSTQNIVAGNRIGTDASGTFAIPNASGGILLSNADDNLIGGTAPASSNLISGNGGPGIHVGPGSEFYGQSVAMDFTDPETPGRLILGSSSGRFDTGAEIFFAYDETHLYVGFRVADEYINRNSTIPYHNDSVEIFIDGDRIANDFRPNGEGGREGFQLVADVDGRQFTRGLGISNDDWSVMTSTYTGGYSVEFAIPLNMIDIEDGPGFTPAGPGSLLRINAALTDNDREVDGQDTYGILWGAPGTRPSHDGEDTWLVDLFLDDGNPVTSEAPLLLTAPYRPSNLVLDGIIGAGARANRILGNRIGTAADGISPLGNAGDGVRLGDTAAGNVVGTPGVGSNRIGHNAGAGVVVTGPFSTGNSIRGNAMFANTGLGIDLGDDGITLNDPLDLDHGPNQFQNTAEVSSVTVGASTRIVGQLHSSPNIAYTIDFYAVSAPGPVQGERYLGSVEVTTDADGYAAFDVLLASATSLGERVTATATDPLGNTSEFSGRRPVANAGGPYVVGEGGSITLNASATTDPDQDASTLTYAWDLDDDGVFGEVGAAAERGDETGINPTFSAAGLDGPSTWTVWLRVTDDSGLSHTVSVEITIVNVPPTAVGDIGTTNEDVPLIIDVLANDYDPAGANDPLTIVSVTDGANGTVVINGDGTVTYTPNPGFAGLDSFEYTIDDGDGGRASATVEITVNNLVDISGIVFDDLDNDGVQGVGESGIEGVTVELFDQLSGLWIASTTTDASGAYFFDVNLGAGTYRLVRAQPAAWLDGRETAGNLGGSVVNGQDSNEIADIVVGEPGSTADAVDYLFALIRPAELFGLVWRDFNDDGEVNFGEFGIDGVAITLDGIDDRGNPVHRTTTTVSGGIYGFFDLRPGTYAILQTQPTGFDDGQESLGDVEDLGVPTAVADRGWIDGNDRFAGIRLVPGAVADRYNFGERPAAGEVMDTGSTASIGFWHNKHGQQLIRSLNGGPNDTQLGDWLAATFPEMYGPGAFYDAEAGPPRDMNLAGKSNAEIAETFVYLFQRNQRNAVTGGPPKVDAQILATALATYVTSEDLAGSAVASSHGLTTSADGIAYRTFNVLNILTEQEAVKLGLVTDSHGRVTILAILKATSAMAFQGLLYDSNGNGIIDVEERKLRELANRLFSAINEGESI